MYKPEKDGPFYKSLNYINNLGQIPASNDKTYLKIFYIKFLLSKTVSFFFTAIGPILHLVMTIMDHAGTDKTEDISITLGASGGVVLCLLFALKYKEWSSLFKDLTDTRLYTKPTTLDNMAKRLNHYGKICFLTAPWVTIIYALAAWFSSKGCNGIDEDFNQICPTFVPIWLPFGANSTITGAIIFALQVVFVGIFITQTFLVECFIMYEATEIFICHISQLNDYIRKIFNETSLLEQRGGFRFCVQYHIYILKLGYRLSALIKYTAGHMSVLSAIVCGCVANQMLNTKPMGSIIFLIAWLFALLCFCHAGQRIKDQTLSVANTVWDSQWYKTDPRTRKDVQFMLLRCQKPICFEAIPLGITDYPFYFMMIKTGYTYFAVMNQSL